MYYVTKQTHYTCKNNHTGQVLTFPSSVFLFQDPGPYHNAHERFLTALTHFLREQNHRKGNRLRGGQDSRRKNVNSATFTTMEWKSIYFPAVFIECELWANQQCDWYFEYLKQQANNAGPKLQGSHLKLFNGKLLSFDFVNKALLEIYSFQIVVLTARVTANTYYLLIQSDDNIKT